MGNVIKKMDNKAAESFFWYNVFLATHMAITTLYYSAAIEAILFLSFRGM